MKSACIILTIVIIVAIMAVCVMVKFATDITVEERHRYHPDSGAFRVAKSLGVIALNEKTSISLAEKYPFVAAITRNSSSEWIFSCFGSVIQVKWIVTSAHCRRPGATHRVLLYLDFLKNHSHTYPILFWRIHEKYNNLPQYDIAVAKLNVDRFAYTLKPAYFDEKPAFEIVSSIWKTVSTMDRLLYLTNDFDIFTFGLASSHMCKEAYGVHIDESLICVDMTRYDDCFVHEFGPLFWSDKVVGVLVLKPKDCIVKVAVFTNVSYFSDWILRSTRSTYHG